MTLPTHEDCSPLSITQVAKHLQAGGTLGKMPGYEVRKGQVDMLKAITTSFNSREHLMVEAGTGVGKSLAYLIPSVQWAWNNSTAVVISTATRNLQSQLLSSDIPRALETLGDTHGKFKVALLKGRTNYACLREVNMSLDPEAKEWAEKSPDGDLDKWNGVFDRSLMSCPAEECSGKYCEYYDKCFFFKARKKAQEAHLVVANHSLVLADACSPGGTILPPYGRLILDEAHNLEDIATRAFAKEFSLESLTMLFKRINKQFKNKDLAYLSAKAQKAASKILYECTGEGIKRRFRKDYTEDVRDLQDGLEAVMIQVIRTLNILMENEESEEAIMRLDAAVHTVQAFMNETEFVLKAENSEWAYWAEEKRLVAAPLSVANDLANLVYKPKDSVIMCSATLRVGNDFKYMAKRLGCLDRFNFVAAESPFDYFKQCTCLACDFLPDPQKYSVAYADALGTLLPKLFAASKGRGLCLFTAYEMMNYVKDLVGDNETGIEFLTQGNGQTREAITTQLKEAKKPTVILGAQSFWEGVDVAGDALSCVAIARLPFAQVGDPITEARSEKIEREGGRPFFDYSLPEAVIKFRQGFGRLIRTKKDHGVVVILDPRLVRKSYGSRFKQACPTTVHVVSSETDLINTIQESI